VIGSAEGDHSFRGRFAGESVWFERRACGFAGESAPTQV